MLEPQDRRLFLESLRPPDGYTLDRAIGTTYSLDLLALLTAPLAFTMFDFQDNEGRPLADPLALLEAVRRHADRTAVFCQAGEIKVPRSHLLLGYLETSIVEVTARERRGVFHPKVWILRFVAPDERVLYRLVCLSRNLTFDRSWDTILVVEGELVVSRKNAFASNHSLVEFVRALPGLAVRDVPVSVKQIVDLFQDELRRVKFEPPDGYEEMTFWPLGHNAKEKWPFEDMDRALVISPFLSDTLLGRLATEGKDHVLVSRLASLEALKAKTRDQFQSLHVLREGTDGESDAGEVPGGAVGLTGLHAKVYVVDKGWYASVFCGSANATDSAFARNVEFLVELRGKKSKYGVEATLASRDGETSLSSMIEEVKVSKSASGDQVLEALEAVLGEARRAVWEAQVSLHVEDVGENAFRMLVRCAKPLRLPDGVALRCWPITLRDEAAQDLAPQAECLFPLSFEALTAFLAFEATVSSEGQTATCRFVLNLPLVGVPSDRKERLLRSLLRSPEQVMRLLLLLLSEGGLELGALLGELQGESKSTAWGAYGEAHLFESLMRALDRTPHKLDDVAGLFADLSRSEQTRGLLPAGFDAIWGPIWETRQNLRPKEPRGKA